MENKFKIYNLKFKKGLALNRIHSGLGFTLIELLVVIAIIGILATIVLINYTGAKAKANYSKTLADMVTISKAVNTYSSIYENYPTAMEISDINGVDSNLKKFISIWPKSPCSGYNYVYTNYTTLNPSLGVGVYLRYGTITKPVNLFYLNISNLKPKLALNISPAEKIKLVDLVLAVAPPPPIRPADSIYDISNKTFSCNDYKTYRSDAQ